MFLSTCLRTFLEGIPKCGKQSEAITFKCKWTCKLKVLESLILILSKTSCANSWAQAPLHTLGFLNHICSFYGDIIFYCPNLLNSSKTPPDIWAACILPQLLIHRVRQSAESNNLKQTLIHPLSFSRIIFFKQKCNNTSVNKLRPLCGTLFQAWLCLPSFPSAELRRLQTVSELLSEIAGIPA